MTIRVEEAPYGFGSAFTLTGPAFTYTAEQALMPPMRIVVRDGYENEVATIHKQHLVGMDYAIHLPGGRGFQIKRDSYWKHSFICGGDGPTLRIFEHMLCRFSVFQDEIQVAAIEKNLMRTGKGNVYEIRANGDVDGLLMAMIVLAINHTEYDKGGGSTVTIDVGRMAIFGRDFDKDWRPKD